MNRRRKVRPIAIACIATALAIGTGAWIVAPRPMQQIDPSYDTPWIPLPRSGMDASDVDVRNVLEWARPFAGVEDADDPSLVALCGRDPDAAMPPRYRLTIGDGFFSAPYRTWRVDIVVHGEQADLSVREAGIPPPPPSPAELGRPAEAVFTEWVTPVTKRVVSTRSLENVRMAWDRDDLWHAPQGNVLCTDGRESRLEACVDGRYALRDRHCGDDRGAEALWRAIQQSVPTPPRGHMETRSR